MVYLNFKNPNFVTQMYHYIFLIAINNFSFRHYKLRLLIVLVLMQIQFAIRHEPFTTFLTFVVPFAQVCLDVCGQIAFLDERLGTYVTGVGLLSGVYFEMPIDFRFSKKFTIAHCALEFFNT